MEKKEELIFKIKKLAISIKMLLTLFKRPSVLQSLGDHSLVFNGTEYTSFNLNEYTLIAGEVTVRIEDLDTDELERLLDALVKIGKEYELKVTTRR